MQRRRTDEDWAYEALYYTDELLESINELNGGAEEVICNGTDSKGNTDKDEGSTRKQLTAEEKKKLIQVVFFNFFLLIAS